ncbi:hypothetical protein [Bradyrhizobium liaoningense]
MEARRIALTASRLAPLSRFEAEGKVIAISGDTVGKVAAKAGVRKLALTHHRPRSDDAMLSALLEDVRGDYSGPVVLGEDLTRIEV